MPFKDDTDFHDLVRFYSPPARGGERGGRAQAPPSVRRAPIGARLSPRNEPSQKVATPGRNRALALAVADLSTTLQRVAKSRAKGRMFSGPKAVLDERRGSQAISEAGALPRTQVAPRVKTSPAKAIAADRRLFNPTPGPKTVFGTQAHVIPKGKSRFRFAFPAVAYPCVVRKTRREVLFAIAEAGKRGRRPKHPRITPYSALEC